MLDETDDLLVMTIRRKSEIFTANLKSFVLRAGDVMILRADSKTIARFLAASGTKLTGDKIDEHDFDSAEMEAVEAVVMAGATIEGSTAHRLNLRRLFSINLLALARKGFILRDPRTSRSTDSVRLSKAAR